MMLLICLFIPVVFAGSAPSSTLYYEGFLIEIKNKILKSVQKTANSSDTLNLSGLGLVGIERKAFNGVSNVKYLNLSHNNLKELPQLVFLALENLEQIYLANNSISSMENIFVGLEKLTTTDISNFNSFDKKKSAPWILLCMNEDNVVKSVQYANNTKNLRAAGKHCDRADLLDNYMIMELSSLVIRNKGIIGFERGWYRLNNLPIDTLDLALNKISLISNGMLNDLPKNLTRVILSGNKIKTLKRGIIVNENLRLLQLDSNEIRIIENDALAKTTLENLDLAHNKLKSVTFVKSLPSTLIRLYLGWNKIVKLLPDAFSRLNKLEGLNLEGNELESLENNVFNGLVSMHELNINDNKLKNITRDSFRGLPDSLAVIRLDNNQITKLQQGTFNNSPTIELDLSNNKIKEIESGTFNATKLNYLYLNNNFLTNLEMSEIVEGLPNVKEIQLGGNNITMRKVSATDLKMKLCQPQHKIPIEISRQEEKSDSTLNFRNMYQTFLNNFYPFRLL